MSTKILLADLNEDSWAEWNPAGICPPRDGFYYHSPYWSLIAVGSLWHGNMWGTFFPYTKWILLILLYRSETASSDFRKLSKFICWERQSWDVLSGVISTLSYWRNLCIILIDDLYDFSLGESCHKGLCLLNYFP